MTKNIYNPDLIEIIIEPLMSHQAQREKETQQRKSSIMETDRSRTVVLLSTQQTQTTVES